MKLKNCCILIATATLIILVSACGGEKKKTQTARHQVGDITEQESDNTFTATILSMSSDSMTVKHIDSNVTSTYCYGRAQLEGNFLGNPTVGADVSLRTDEETRHVLYGVTISQLYGLWIHDHSQHRGMRFSTDGALASVNDRQVSFRNWHVAGDKLVIYYVDNDQKASSNKEYWVDESEIVALSDDELQLRFRDTLYICTRQQAAIKFQTK